MRMIVELAEINILSVKRGVVMHKVEWSPVS
jgi:hypothetical protein